MGALYLTTQLRAIELEAQADLPAGTLMERAGGAAAGWLHARVGGRRSTFVVLCGPGNNGGDGFVCARRLRELGHDCICWAPAPSASADSQAARSAWTAAGGTIASSHPAALAEGGPAGIDIIVDAMFGIGLARPLEGAFLEAATWAAGSAARIVALDLPSGLDADTGLWVGAVAGAAAMATLTFLGDKPGLHTADGCDAVGEVHVDPLGVPPAIIEDRAQGRMNDPAHFLPVLRRRPANSHKGSFGSVAVIGGSPGMAGAALLAARAALRLGAGRVYACCVGQSGIQWDPICPELMFRRLDQLPQTESLVVGCGLGQGEDAVAALRFAIDQPAALVLDADALNLLAARPDLAQAAAARASPTVISPHPLEAARLLAGTNRPEPVIDRIGACRALSQRLRSVCILKGAGTVVADGRAAQPSWWINPTGGPALASAGTGDVLSGMIGALLAQGYGAECSALAAAWLHGSAARAHDSDCGLLASEVAALAALELARLKRPR